ncbi:MAG: hypothetical protein HOH14_00275 [Gammaproteobacteria bacterium]|nr:hypothetical protein [Gammaproteobacteria bacterium]MBT6041905.1 hypothetical protein [Gammaproteobacteria bacterium]
MCIIILGLPLAALPAFAHHAFSAEFDATKPVRLEGKINRMEWINPHSWLHVDVSNDDGSVDTWMVEAGPAGVLVRRGWRKDSIVSGTDVIVEGYQARDGSMRANGRDVTLPNGERLFAGSTGPGAPPEAGEQ